MTVYNQPPKPATPVVPGRRGRAVKITYAGAEIEVVGFDEETTKRLLSEAVDHANAMFKARMEARLR